MPITSFLALICWYFWKPICQCTRMQYGIIRKTRQRDKGILDERTLLVQLVVWWDVKVQLKLEFQICFYRAVELHCPKFSETVSFSRLPLSTSVNKTSPETCRCFNLLYLWNHSEINSKISRQRNLILRLNSSMFVTLFIHNNSLRWPAK